MTTILAWVRLDLPRRWRSLVVLAMLVAVSGGTVMTALAGAHRGSTSLDRLVSRTEPLDAVVVPNTPGFDWAPFRKLDYVEALSEFALGTTPAIEGGVSSDAMDFLHADDEWGRTFERQVVLEGRTFDQHAPDEAVMTPAFAEKNDLHVGDTIVVHLTSPEQADMDQDQLDPADYAGPVIQVRMVGIVRSPWVIDSPGGQGALMFSPGMFATYRASFMGIKGKQSWTNAQLRLKDGAADIPRLREDVKRITGRSDIDVWNSQDEFAKIQRNLDFEARCLIAFALAALVAGVFLVGQAVSRYAAAETGELRTGRALGMTPRQTVMTSAVGPFLASVAGATLAVAASIVASTRFPIGTAKGIEPSPGLDVDIVTLAGVSLVVVALVTVGAAFSAAVSLRASATGAPRRSAAATVVSSSGFPVPVVIGTRFALERGTGRAAVPVLPALVGAVVGVLGVVAVFSFSHGIDDAVDHPERFGQTYQAAGFVGFNGREFGPTDKIGDALRSLDYVTGVDHGRVGVATGPGGDGSVELWSYDTGEKSLPTVVTSGRMPESQDEVLLTPGSLKALDTEVGDTISLGGSRAERELTVVGSGFVPTGPHNSYNDGGFLTANGYDALFDDFKFSLLFVSVAESARGSDLSDRLNTDVGALVPQMAAGGESHLFDDPTGNLDVSETIGQLRQIRVLPLALGIFLALLAIGAVGHAIATATRRRAHDLAVLRAVGMTPWQSRGVVASQATVLVLVGLVFGLPVGLAVGRTVWRLVADYTPLAYVPPTAALVLALIGPIALLVAYAVAAWPAIRASGLRISHVLRAE
jgi:ABC-type lipoprotein release transport system permease subunit